MQKNYTLLFILLIGTVQLVAQTAAPTYEYRNGHWFNGKDFTVGTFYTVNGKLSRKAPSKVDTVIDLSSYWIVPATADFHCLSLADNTSAEYIIKQYMEEGVFYVQALGHTKEGRAKLQPLLKKYPVEARYSNGIITSTLGYPFLSIEGPANNVRNPAAQKERYAELKDQRKMLGDGYWFMDNKADLEKNWKALLAQNPEVIMFYLINSEKGGYPDKKGLTPEVAKALVKKAHKAGLRALAFVETVEDVRLAMKIKADGLANLPGGEWDGNGSAALYELTDEDIKKLAKMQMPVCPLLSRTQTVNARPALQDWQSKTLNRMLEQGVNVVIGSGDSQRSTRSELNYWYQIGKLPNLPVIKVLCENTPRAIYPKRKIGKLEDGYEANFLVLYDNPLQNLLKLRAIWISVHNGLPQARP